MFPMDPGFNISISKKYLYMFFVSMFTHNSSVRNSYDSIFYCELPLQIYRIVFILWCTLQWGWISRKEGNTNDGQNAKTFQY